MEEGGVSRLLPYRWLATVALLYKYTGWAEISGRTKPSFGLAIGVHGASGEIMTIDAFGVGDLELGT